MTETTRPVAKEATTRQGRRSFDPASRPESGRGSAVGFRDVARSFGDVRALDGFSLDIAPGELVALLGPSGCGKTTALRILAGFESHDSGQVLVDGADIGATPPQRRDMGMVFQSYSLFPNMTAEQNVAFGLRMRRQDASRRRSRARELLELVGLSTHGSHYPHQMSGGQQQRVALARALAIEPRVLLLDEPLSALDAKVRLSLREEIKILQNRLGTTTLFVTHDQEEALSLADRVGVMNAGRLEQVATPAELYNRPATAFVAQFVGTMNRLAAVTAERGKVTVLGREVAAEGPVTFLPGTAVHVLVRPEGLRLRPAGNGPGVVVAKTFHGATTRLRVLLSGDVAVEVDLPSSEADALAHGESVEVTMGDSPVLLEDPSA